MSKTVSPPSLPPDPIGRERDARHDWSGVFEAIRRYALARRKQDELADDIAQETVLRCLEYCRAHDVASIYALAYRIAANLIADHHRSAKGHTGELEESIECAAPLPDQVRYIGLAVRLQLYQRLAMGIECFAHELIIMRGFCLPRIAAAVTLPTG